MMNKAVKKTLIIVGIILGTLVGLFLLLYLILAIIGAAMYGEARNLRKYVCNVADTGSGLAPQGITYAAEYDAYIQTGYDGDDISQLYIVKGKDWRKVKLVGTDGKPIKGHAGGVTCTKKNVYIANGAYLMLFDLDELVNAEGNAVTMKQKFAVDNNAAYCYSDDEFLYVGEFYRAGNYETDKAHRFKTPSGANNKAILSCYKLDGDGLLIGEQPYPEYCVSIPELVQGCAFKDGTMVLSRSYGLVNSDLDYHSLPSESFTTMTVKFKNNAGAEERTVPVYCLDDSTKFRTITLPSFSEDITIVGDRVVVTNEASANKYFVGKLFGAHKVYSYPLFTK